MQTFQVDVSRHAQFPMISGKSTYYTHYHITVEALVRTEVLWQAQGATGGTCVTTNCLHSYSTHVTVHAQRVSNLQRVSSCI